jgi:hypothetical protein
VQKLLVSEFLVDIVNHTVQFHYERAREEIIESLGQQLPPKTKASIEPILNPRNMAKLSDGVKWRPR